MFSLENMMKSINTVRRPTFLVLLSALAFVSTHVKADSVNFSYDGDYAYFDVNADQKVTYSDAQLAQILAPVALYPDTLLTHVLIASSHPLEIVQAHNYINQHHSNDANVNMTYGESQQWEPSVVALMAFPEVLQKMSDNLDWTLTLGEAFVTDEQQVLASIQELRHEAHYADTLSKLNKMNVVYADDQIIIQPRNTSVVYVPYYDPRIMYGRWKWRGHSPVFFGLPRHLAHRSKWGIYWSPRVRVNFDFFFGGFRWSDGYVAIRGHRGTRDFYSYRAITHHKSAKPYKQKWKKHKKYNKGEKWYKHAWKKNKREHEYRHARLSAKELNKRNTKPIHKANLKFAKNERTHKRDVLVTKPGQIKYKERKFHHKQDITKPLRINKLKQQKASKAPKAKQFNKLKQQKAKQKSKQTTKQKYDKRKQKTPTKHKSSKKSGGKRQLN